MKKILTTLTLLTATLGSFAQTTGQVQGIVEDGSAKTISAATISLLRAKDSSLAKVSAADGTGKFGFEGIPEGRYLVSVTAVGHQKAFSEAFTINSGNSSIALKTITLIPQEKMMAGVVVTGRKPLIEQKIDRTVVNVDASITNVGASAMEVLEKSPGLSVDKDGNISLKGKQGVIVLVDGRPTQLGAADLANYLRNLQSSQLDQIEIMTNPPARFDAAGNAGVINIKTKKNKQFGYTGSVTVGAAYGRHLRGNESVNLSYRQNKVNLFANLSHNYRKSTQDLYIQRNFLHSDTKEILYRFEQASELVNKNESYNGKIGLDYSINNKTTLGAVVSGFSNPSDFTGTTLTNKLVNRAVNERTRSISRNKENFRNLGANLNFRRVLDSTGRELTADLDYVVYDGLTRSGLYNSYTTPTGAEARRSDSLMGHLPQMINIYSGKADYTQPLKSGGRFEAGIKSSIVRTDNNAIYDTLIHGALLRDKGRSNHFVYEENINAAYLNLSGNLSKKFSAQLGLRVEQTRATGTSKGYRFDTLTTSFVNHDTTFKNSYAQLFPTAYLQYKASEQHSFVLNYGRRIRRPNYESLNPFMEFIDRYTYQMGNPNLKPQFSHNIELSHTFKNFLTTTVNYTTTNNIIQQVLEQNEQRSETFIKQVNIASQRQWGLAVSAGMPITKWWTGNLYVNVFRNDFNGVVSNTPVSLTATAMMLNGSQQFKLGKTTSAELNGWFRTTNLDGVMKIKPVGMFSIGLSQQVMKGKGTVRMTLRDVLSTQHFKGESKYGTVDAAFQNYNDSRAINVGFTYRFSKGKVNGGAPRKRNSSAADEQNRVGGGSGN